MAIVAEGVTSNGFRYFIHDDYMAARGSEEERRVIEMQRRAAHNILKGWAERHDSITPGPVRQPKALKR